MRVRLALHGAAAAVSATILAPLAMSGYVLSYDMNFVPRQTLRLDLIAPIDVAPRAVPLDAAVSLINLAVPGWLLQRAILIALIWAAFVGAARLVPTDRLSTRLVAGVAYAWTPFLAERLLLGQWALLIAYSALPWLVMAALRVRRGEPGGWPRLILAGGLSALTPSGGVIAGTVAVVLVAGRPWRRTLLTFGSVLVLNSPWLVAALTSSATIHSDPNGVAAFAARSENWAGAFVALLGTGGIWNAETTPASRSSALVPILTLIWLLMSIWGYWKHRYLIHRRLLVVALCLFALAASSTFPGGRSALAWLVEHGPGAGLLRDSQKFILPYVLVLALGIALGAEAIATTAATKISSEAGRVVVAGFAALLVIGLPDLAFGGMGALRPVPYPQEWDRVAQLIAADPGPVLSLPLSEYRQYEWNRDRVVIDPAARYLDAPVTLDDTLVVGSMTITGESLQAARVRAEVAGGRPVSGFRWVLVQHRGSVSAAVPASVSAGLQQVHNGRFLALYRSDAAIGSVVDPRRHLPVVSAEIVVLLLLIVAAARIAATARK